MFTKSWGEPVLWAETQPSLRQRLAAACALSAHDQRLQNIPRFGHDDVITCAKQVLASCARRHGVARTGDTFARLGPHSGIRDRW
jgi:hypothetical protein